MIIRIVKMTFKPENVPAFLDVFEGSKNKIRNFEGCENLELLRDVNDPSVLFTYSFWKEPEHLDKYRNSELFKKTWEKTKPLFAEKAEAWSVERVTDVG